MTYFDKFKVTEYDIFDTGNVQLLTNLALFTTIGGRLLDNVTYYENYTVPDGYRPDNVSQDLYNTPDYYWTLFLVNPGIQNYFRDWPKSSGDIREYVEDKYPNLALIAKDSFGDDSYAGKIRVGETVEGQISGAIGTVIAKYPTKGYVTLELLSGTFRAEGEAILSSQGGSLVGVSIIKEADAPAYHIDIVTGERTEKRTAGTKPVTHFEQEIQNNNDKSVIRVIKPEYMSTVIKDFTDRMQG